MKEKSSQSSKKTNKQFQIEEALNEKKFLQRRKLLLLLLLSALAGYWGWRTQYYPEYLVDQAELLLDSDPERASIDLEKATSLRGGNYPQAQLLWTHALLQENRVEEALGCFSTIDESATLETKELLTVARLALGKGVPLLASFALERIPGDSPQHLEAVTQLMSLRLQQGDLEEVQKLGMKIIENPSLPAEAWLLMAQAHERQLNPQAATAAYHKFLMQEKRPAPRVFALRNLLNLSIELGQFKVAEKTLAELFSLTQPTSADQLSAAKLQRLRGRNAEAQKIVAEILQDHPLNLGAIELRGLLACDRRDEPTAENDLLTVLQQQPWNKQAHYQLALCLQRQGKKEAAQVHFERNNYLTQLSLRILDLQSSAAVASPLAEQKRLEELINAFEELGQTQTAQQLRERLIQKK